MSAACSVRAHGHTSIAASNSGEFLITVKTQMRLLQPLRDELGEREAILRQVSQDRVATTVTGRRVGYKPPKQLS
jgi:hypothetical protein